MQSREASELSSLHHDDVDYIDALDSYAKSMFAAGEMIRLTETDDEVSIDEAIEIFRDLRDYEKEIATFYILGQLSAYSELDDPVEE